MDQAPKDRLPALWRETIAQCRRTLDFWYETDFRVCVNGIDITDAERAMTKLRIAHLEKLIAAVKAEEAEC